MGAISQRAGPVAVTGAAGFIGSHIVASLVRRGYDVRACVRDPSNYANIAHLSLIGRQGPGRVTLYGCDMWIAGAYDAAFAGCAGVFHAAAEMGNLEGSSPQKVYEGGLAATKGVMASVAKAATVERLIYTSSFAAVGHPSEEGYRYTEDSWADMRQELRPREFAWTLDTTEHSRDIAYAMTKVDAERYVYAEAETQAFDAIGICPLHVIGPLLSASHRRPWTWQTRIGDLLEGCSLPRMFWNIVDVRDVAEAQVLAAESAAVSNGERFILAASDESGLVTQDALQAMLRRFYPGHGIGGSYRPGLLRRSPVAFAEKAMRQLELKPHSVEDAVHDNADSLIALGLVTLRAGEDNWQHEANDLGLASKWRPHVYPASDPATGLRR